MELEANIPRKSKLIKRPTPHYIQILRRCIYITGIISTTIASTATALGMAFLVFFRDGLSEGLFTAMGSIVMLFGVLLLALCAMQYSAIQPNNNLQPLLGKKLMLIILQMLLLSICIYEMLVAYHSWSLYCGILKVDNPDLVSSTSQFKSTTEIKLAKIFNAMYFQAVASCTNDSFWFWEWVNDKCSSEMSKSNCQRCDTTSTFCIVDSGVCSRYTDEHPSCPYSVCRGPIIFFTCNRILKPFLIIVCGALLNHILQFAFNIPLIFYELRRKAIVPVKIKVISTISLPTTTHEILEVATEISHSNDGHDDLFSL